MTPYTLETFVAWNHRQEVKIDCIGDAMVDEYYNVKVNRISPEFPMPIMSSEDEHPVKKPGGAANVVHQYKNCNVKARLIGFGDYYMAEVCHDHKIGTDMMPYIFYGRANPVKKRFLDNGVQVKRWDVEKPFYGVSEENRMAYHTEIMGRYDSLPDVAILSDYNKGFFDLKSIPLYMERLKKVTTIVDPKKGPIHKWKGCTYFKPNAAEARELSGRDDWKNQCKFFAINLGCKGVVITQGGDGVVGWEDGKFFEYRPEKKVQVESVIGAGDCFVAFFAQAIALEFGAEMSSKIAYEAGRLYVQNKMNRPIHPVDLVWCKCVLPEDLAKRDFKLVFTNGCFDVLHTGHLETLRFAKSKGDKLVVAVNADESIRRLKGPERPLVGQADRMHMLAALEPVDYVVSFKEDTPLEVMKKIKPDVLVKGGDYKADEVVGKDLVSEVHISPFKHGISTSAIIEKRAYRPPGFNA